MFSKKQIDSFGDWSHVLYPLLSDSALMKPIMDVVMKYKVRPNRKDIFRAFRECRYNDLKVIIVGQDPYPDAVTADGLAFSAQYLTASLEIIQNELYRSYDFRAYKVTDLTPWANQGVLLLNKALTCLLNKPGSHQDLWQPFMERLVERLANPNLIWMLWGNKAQQLNPKGITLRACHPVAEARGSAKFVGCNHFIEADKILKEEKIQWITFKNSESLSV